MQLKVGERLPSIEGVEEVNPSVLSDTNALQSEFLLTGLNPSHLKILTARL